MLAVVGCACLFAQTCMLHFSAKHHISPATTLEATQAYCSCGRRRITATHRRSSAPPPSRHRRHAVQTPRSPIIATSCFLSSPRESSVGSLPRPSTLYVTRIVHQTPLPYPVASVRSTLVSVLVVRSVPSSAKPLVTSNLLEPRTPHRLP